MGALLAGIMLTRRPLRRLAGRKLLIVVVVFGRAWSSSASRARSRSRSRALAVSGFADMISMNIRATITAFATPDSSVAA